MRCEESEAEDELVSEELITPEIRTEIAADITQILSDPEQMQAVSQSKYLQWKERNPGFAALYIEVLLPIVMLLISLAQLGVSIWQARPVKNSQVYEEPTSKSNVVYNLTVENNVTVVGDVPYYYEVEFVNPETEELVTGYIYKGNVTIEEPSETEVQTETTEESEPIPVATVSQTEPNE